MSKYLLLRNNKQAGPYSLEEIREMALKAYDLVWVEGKSAAWRYPGEIEELKSFAPLVEEQPFDRFFKKPVQEDQSSNIIKQPVAEVEKSRYAPSVSEQVPVVQTNKAVYYNLPADAKKTEEKDPEVYVEKKQPPREKIIQRESVNKEPVQKSFAQSIPAAKIEAIGLDDNFSSPADEIKSLYAQRTPRQQRKKFAQLHNLAKPIAVGIGVVILLGAGIFIGLSINNHGLNSPQRNIAKDQAGITEPQSIYPVKTIPASSLLPVSHANKNSNNIILQDDQLVNNPDNAAVMEKKRAKSARQKLADSMRAQKTLTSKSDSGVSTMAHDAGKKTTDAQAEHESSIKNNIEDYISLSASKFNVGTFGGISDLQLTVSNTSPFPLDLVVVEVQYVQSNKKIFKTENLYFHNIGAGAAIMEEAPKSSRGIKVKYRITIISSKSIGISFSEL